MKVELNFVHEEDFVRFADKVNEIATVLNAVNTEAAKRMAGLENRIRLLEMNNGMYSAVLNEGIK